MFGNLFKKAVKVPVVRVQADPRELRDGISWGDDKVQRIFSFAKTYGYLPAETLRDLDLIFVRTCEMACELDTTRTERRSVGGRCGRNPQCQAGCLGRCGKCCSHNPRDCDCR